MVQEVRETGVSSYVYSPDEEYTPLARVDAVIAAATAAVAIETAKSSSRVYHFHTNLVGTPLEVTDEVGDLAWTGKYRAWGKVEHGEDGTAIARIDQPLRYAGQYADEGTGLHYNTFRFYDPDIGRFISQDPIGLSGGANLYAYAPNPTGWLDPLGLSCGSDAVKLGKNLGPAPALKHNPHHIVMSNSTDPNMIKLRNRMKRMGIDINAKENGIWLPNKAANRVPNAKTTAHAGEGVHGNAYKQHVWDTLKDAKTKTDFKAGLAKLQSELAAGKVFPARKVEKENYEPRIRGIYYGKICR